MSEVADLIAGIKRQLKVQGMTYRDVAQALNLSEPSVKRLFSNERFTVERLAQLSHLLGFTLGELLQVSSASPAEIHRLSQADELRLVSTPAFLLVAVCILNHWTVADIVRVYRLSEGDCHEHLLELQAMGLITLASNERIRLRIARDFVWIDDGPIQQFFRREGLTDFLNSAFTQADASMAFVHGMLTEPALAELQKELQRLRTRFSALHDESADAPLAQRRGIAMLLARREWEPAVFQQLRRKP